MRAEILLDQKASIAIAILWHFLWIGAFFILIFWIFSDTMIIAPGVLYSQSDSYSGCWSNPYYPPLRCALTVWIGSVFGNEYTFFLFAYALLVVLSVVYLSMLVRRISDASILPVLVIPFLLFLPGIIYLTIRWNIETILIFLTVASVYHLHSSDSLRCWRHIIPAGIFIVLGMWTKWTFPLYLLGLLAMAIIADPKKYRELTFRRGAAFLLPVGLISCVWYLVSFDAGLFMLTSMNSPIYGADDTYLMHLQTVLTEWAAWFGTETLFMIGLAILAGMLAKRKWLKFALLLVLAHVPLFVFALPVHYEIRYIIPALPAVVFMVALSVNELENARVARLLIAILVLAFFVLLPNVIRLSHHQVSTRNANVELLAVRHIGDASVRGNVPRTINVYCHPININVEIAQYIQRWIEPAGRFALRSFDDLEEDSILDLLIASELELDNLRYDLQSANTYYISQYNGQLIDFKGTYEYRNAMLDLWKDKLIPVHGACNSVGCVYYFKPRRVRLPE